MFSCFIFPTKLPPLVWCHWCVYKKMRDEFTWWLTKFSIVWVLLATMCLKTCLLYKQFPFVTCRLNNNYELEVVEVATPRLFIVEAICFLSWLSSSYGILFDTFIHMSLRSLVASVQVRMFLSSAGCGFFLHLFSFNIQDQPFFLLYNMYPSSSWLF